MATAHTPSVPDVARLILGAYDALRPETDEDAKVKECLVAQVSQVRAWFESPDRTLTDAACYSINHFLDSELDFATPGNRGMGRMTENWSRFGGQCRQELKSLPQETVSRLRRAFTDQIVSGYLFAEYLLECSLNAAVPRAEFPSGAEGIFEQWIPTIYSQTGPPAFDAQFVSAGDPQSYYNVKGLWGYATGDVVHALFQEIGVPVDAFAELLIRQYFDAGMMLRTTEMRRMSEEERFDVASGGAYSLVRQLPFNKACEAFAGNVSAARDAVLARLANGELTADEASTLLDQCDLLLGRCDRSEGTGTAETDKGDNVGRHTCEGSMSGSSIQEKLEHWKIMRHDVHHRALICAARVENETLRHWFVAFNGSCGAILEQLLFADDSISLKLRNNIDNVRTEDLLHIYGAIYLASFADRRNEVGNEAWHFWMGSAATLFSLAKTTVDRWVRFVAENETHEAFFTRLVFRLNDEIAPILGTDVSGIFIWTDAMVSIIESSNRLVLSPNWATDCQQDIAAARQIEPGSTGGGGGCVISILLFGAAVLSAVGAFSICF
ncbi:MAG TPA: hypothetical protein VMV69_27295 [Pirellulales bacterium]|nr:hypothetical protein [Pirellulales bacterium]